MTPVHEALGDQDDDITETGWQALALVRPKGRELVREVLAERQGEDALGR